MAEDGAFPDEPVTPLLATAVLVLLAGALFIAPLVPAIVEFRLKRDAKPLHVIQQHAGEIKFFADGFRAHIEPLQPVLRQCLFKQMNASGALPDGEDYLLVCSPAEPGAKIAREKRARQTLVATGVDIAFPPGLEFAKEIYAAGQLVAGDGDTFRAILGEKDILLQRGCKVMRWAHAAGKFQAQQDCELYGRISSDQEIRLQTGCIFQRLHAPRVTAGNLVPAPNPGISFPERPALRTSPRRLFEEDLEIRPGDIISGDLVTRGKLHIGAHAQVFGSVKSDRDLVLEEGVAVLGSVISAGRMHVGPRCSIRGLAIAEHEMAIGAQSQCGTLEKPTTASAPSIRLALGAEIFGTLWAREQGLVVEAV